MKLNGKMLAIGGVVAVIACGGYFFGTGEPEDDEKLYEIDGTVTWMDPASREASMEFMRPGSSQLREMTQVIPEECPITFEGKPAQFADIQVGDSLQVKAKLNRRTKDIQILSLVVTRSDGAPATQEAGDPTAENE